MLAIIDGDPLLFKACYTRKRCYKGVEITSLDPETGKKIEPLWSASENDEYIEACWKIFNNRLEELLESAFADDYVMAVGGAECFRFKVYPDYKIKRRLNPSPLKPYVNMLAALAVSSGIAIAADGKEADDFVRIWANEAESQGEAYTIIREDKDLACIPGVHCCIHDPMKPKYVTIEHKDALLSYYRQFLEGDSSDSIPGIKGVGPIAANKALSDCHDEADFREVVVDMYKAYYEDEWRNMLLSNGKMLHIQRHHTDYFTLAEWGY